MSDIIENTIQLENVFDTLYFIQNTSLGNVLLDLTSLDAVFNKIGSSTLSKTSFFLRSHRNCAYIDYFNELLPLKNPRGGIRALLTNVSGLDFTCGFYDSSLDAKREEKGNNSRAKLKSITDRQ